MTHDDDMREIEAALTEFEDCHCDYWMARSYGGGDAGMAKQARTKLLALIRAHNQLGLPPAPFVLAVIFGANMSYATPMAYKTNLLVFSAGGYKFSDFLRVGTPLLLIMWVALSFLLVWQSNL